MTQDKIRQTIEKQHLIHPGEHVVIGLSGGPDSVCLFHVLRSLQAQRKFFLYAVHINHGFRGAEAEKDQKYVEVLCKKAGVCCIPLRYNCPQIAKDKKITPEEAGRMVRYQAFVKVAQSLSKNGIPAAKIKIAVAQNANDQAETLLMRLLRGTGPDGLAGIAYSRKEQGFSIIRPLLDVKRDEIEAYCKQYNLQPRIDHTNAQTVYTRNKIRLELIPWLEKNFNKNIIDALCRLSKIAGEDKEYMQQLAYQAYLWAKTSPGVLDVKKLSILAPAIRHRAIIKAFEEIGLIQDITAAHLQAGDQLIKENITSKTIHFPNNYAMTISYGTVYFHKSSANSPSPNLPGANDQNRSSQNRNAQTQFSPMELSIRFLLPGEPIPPQSAVFDWGKLKQAYRRPIFSLRTRRQGDYIHLNIGRKKIQDYLVDQKVPAELRDRIPMVAIGSEILWIIANNKNGLPGHRYTGLYKPDQTTKRAIVLETICEA